MVVSNRNLLFQGSIFRGHVSFREGNWCQSMVPLCISPGGCNLLEVAALRELQSLVPEPPAEEGEEPYQWGWWTWPLPETNSSSPLKINGWKLKVSKTPWNRFLQKRFTWEAWKLELTKMKPKYTLVVYMIQSMYIYIHIHIYTYNLSFYNIFHILNLHIYVSTWIWVQDQTSQFPDHFWPSWSFRFRPVGSIGSSWHFLS